MIKRIILVLILAILTTSLVGCKTVQGVGEDIKSVGEAGEEVVK